MMARSSKYLFRPRLGVSRGAYAERPLVERGSVDVSISTWVQRLRGALGTYSGGGLDRRLEAESEFFHGREEAWLSAHVLTLRGLLTRDSEPGVDLIARAIAFVAEIAARSTG